MTTDFFEGKPDWFRGYAETIATYVVGNARVQDGPYGTKRSDVSVHFDACKIAEIHDVDESAESGYAFDSFGDGSYPAIFVTARVTCECGEIKNVTASAESNIAEIISSAFWK